MVSGLSLSFGSGFLTRVMVKVRLMVHVRVRVKFKLPIMFWG